jgi:hypothetical protein
MHLASTVRSTALLGSTTQKLRDTRLLVCGLAGLGAEIGVLLFALLSLKLKTLFYLECRTCAFRTQALPPTETCALRFEKRSFSLVDISERTRFRPKQGCSIFKKNQTTGGHNTDSPN